MLPARGQARSTTGDSVGLPPREETAPDGDEPVPTSPPSGGDDTGSPVTEGDGGDGTSTGVIIGLVLAILAVAATIAFATVILARRFR